MQAPFRILSQLLVLLLSCLGLFLSAWMVVPAPTWPLLLISIAVPEVSPWLLGLTAATSLLARLSLPRSRWRRFALCASLVGLGLSALPLLQLPATNGRMAAAMRDGLGQDYLAQIPSQVQRHLRPQPFRLGDAFRGFAPKGERDITGIRFASPDGMPLHLNVYRPLRRGVNPALVVIYGGAWQSGEPGQNADFSRYMAVQGYTVFAIDYRHTPRYRFPDQLADVRSALAFIRQHAAEYEADPERLALFGRSAGAQLAMLAAYQPDAPPVRAVVSYYGPVDLAGGYADPPRPDPFAVRSVLRTFLGGTPTQLPQQYRLASPISYADQPLPPTLLVQGGRDQIVQAKFVQRMQAQLQRAGNPVVLLEIPWANHAFDQIFGGPSNQLALYYTERFLAWVLR